MNQLFLSGRGRVLDEEGVEAETRGCEGEGEAELATTFCCTFSPFCPAFMFAEPA